MDTINKGVNAVLGLLEGGTTGAIIKGVVLLIAIGLIWWFKSWIDKQKVIQARKEEAEKKIEDKQKEIIDNEQEDQKAKDDSKAADDFLK